MILDKTIILPLDLADDDSLAILITDIDQGLLRKMAADWLKDLVKTIRQSLQSIKEVYVYPETGLFSSRILDLVWNGTDRKKGAFFLIALPERTRHATGNLLKLIRKAHLMESMLNSPVGYFGGNVFGIYQDNISRGKSLRLARRFIGRLKREGAPYVHIGIIQVNDRQDKTRQTVREECWQALEIAEKRGPYSLCEAAYLHDRHNHPFAPLEGKAARRLQNRWRGLSSFSLLLLRLEGGAIKPKEVDDLAAAVKDCFPEAFLLPPTGPGELYVLLPDIDKEKSRQIAGRIKKTYEKKYASRKVAVGISCWPELDFSKTASLVNCRRALMHGDFFGPGSVTVFDHVSLNVSGDYFFDEGDYRSAVKDYRAGLKMKPEEINLLNSLGVALTELNRLTEAIRCFDTVLRREPKNFMALVNKGFAMQGRGQKKQALTYLARAQKCREFASSAVFADVSLQLGRLYIENGGYSKAVKVLENLQDNIPEKAGYLFYSLLGEGYAATGKNKKAVRMLQKAVQVNPHDAKSLSILGELYGKEGQGSDIALSLCSQAVMLDNRAWDNWYRLAKLRYLSEDYLSADAAVKESLRRNRKAVDAIFLSGKIQEKVGNDNLARRAFRKVLQETPGNQEAAKALQELA